MSVYPTGYKPVPESITNIIPHKYEVIILAGGTGLFCATLIGTGLQLTMGAIALVVHVGDSFLQAKKDQITSKNNYLYIGEILKNKKEQTASLTKISKVITNSIVTGICYKGSEFAISYFGSHCYRQQEDIYIQNASCSAIFGGVILSTICVGVSAGYLLKNLFK